MTSLREFLDGLPHGGTTAFASQIGISTVYLAQLAARQDGREPSPELCVRIEQETSGAVRRWHLRRDDWHRIWPELIGTPGAPAVPRQSTPLGKPRAAVGAEGA